MAHIKPFAIIHPDLLEEWDWEKNKEIANPFEIGCTSTKKVWWKCGKCGYEWQATINNRHNGRGCPYCAKNVVWSGHNDLATLYPELLKDWDYLENKELDPTKISTTSKKKAWWRCHVCDFHWLAEIGSRAAGGNGCPYCSGKALWIGHNDLETTNPELVLEWDYEKNKELLPTMVTAGSQKKVWWKCKVCGHQWFASVSSRSRGTGCPECGRVKMGENHRITSLRKGENSLATLNPKLAAEWNYDKNELTPSDVTANTHQKVWWTCPNCGYVYCSSIANRHKNGSGCPVCANQVLCTGINDLQTLYPDISAEWSEKNEKAPNNVLAGGHTKYYFKCRHCGNVWKASISARIKGTGCPKCASSLHTSIPEQVIYQCLKKVLPSTKNSYRPKWLNGREIDIYIPEIKVGIEYDGSGWHQEIDKDVNKTKVMKSHGITMIRVREPNCPKIDDGSIIIVTSEPKSDQLYLQNAITSLFAVLNEKFNMKIDPPRDISDVYLEELKKYRSRELGKSVASVYPELMEEWDESKNKGLDPQKIPPRSNVSIWWKCKTCGYEWKATIDRRASGVGCPYCAHEVVWYGHNDVATVRPDMLEEWDYENNVVSPQEVAPNSHKKIAWRCSICGHRWKSPLYSKAAGHGCPKCARKAATEKRSKKVKNLDTGQAYKSARIASEETGISHSSITRVCRGEGKKAGGYHWGYVSNDE